MTLTQLSSDRGAGARDVPVIIGAGLAGLVTALRLAPCPVVVLSAGRLGEGAASGWAQGGLAAALGDDDSPELHAADTLAAGAGLCEPDVVRRITAAAPAAVAYLAGLGTRFDRSPEGVYRLGLEGAHSRNRIVHAAGDATGAEILRAVVEAVRRTSSITVLEQTLAGRIMVKDGRVAGLLVERASGLDGSAREPVAPSDAPSIKRQVAGARRLSRIDTDAVVLATGGSGQLWQHTTNPRGSQGQGLALAARAGAELRDLEMVQFHPTALDVGLDPMPLVSEAVRGAGAVLVDATGAPLTDDPLAARDVVARAVWRELARGGRAFLDARQALGVRFGEAFPTVARACLAAGIDPARDLIPVRPAAHYQCGGVTVDLHGRTTVPGLWAVGEVASTGLHGANRLASNSLLEAVVCGGWVAEDVAARLAGQSLPDHPHMEPIPVAVAVKESPDERGRVPLDLRTLMSQAVGIVRDEQGLAAAEATLLDAVRSARTPRNGAEAVGAVGASSGSVAERLDDASLVALLVTHSARRRQESRGGHTRLDHPDTADLASHTTVTLADILSGACDQRDGAITRREPSADRPSTPRDQRDGAITRGEPSADRPSTPRDERDGAITRGEPSADRPSTPRDQRDRAITRRDGAPRRVSAPSLPSHPAAKLPTEHVHAGGPR
ncbi:MAG TPA: L-aspartate oxidase [Intrasporangium sp.]|nr:L-aspartate oxidase [Intrasporangium sp.]